eukprot:Hpha_TRINITY_DN16469_c0_g2::TRINITY_DN16469_c0_g2_i1::g.162030::m.162030
MSVPGNPHGTRFSLSVGEHVHPVVPVIKYLGFLLDDALTFVPQARATLRAVTGVARNTAARLAGLPRADMGRMVAMFSHTKLDFVWPGVPLLEVQAAARGEHVKAAAAAQLWHLARAHDAASAAAAAATVV